MSMIKIKKKSLLLITCFFLCSSVIVFFYLRKNKIASPEITKKFEEEKKKLEEEKKKLEEEKKKLEAEVERLLTELKEKNNADQKEENRDNQEKVEDLPFLLRWQGATISLVVSIIAAILIRNAGVKYVGVSEIKNFIIETVTFIILFFVLFPFLLAIKGYKDKSYKERYCLLWRSYWKTFFCVFFSALLGIAIVIEFYLNTDEKNNNSDNNNNS